MEGPPEQNYQITPENDKDKVNVETNNEIKLAKLKTLSVTVLKPISLDGGKTRPKKTQKNQEKKNHDKNIYGGVVKFAKEYYLNKLQNCTIVKMSDKNVNKEVNTSNEKAKIECFVTKKVITEEGKVEEEIQIKTSEVSQNMIHETPQVENYVVINNTELLYECDVCNGTYISKEKLDAHKITHQTQEKQTYNINEVIKMLPNTKRPYCPICKKFLAGRSSQLMEHLRIHTGERPFICDTCGKSSRTKHHLLEHIRTHTKEKISCKLCDKSFTQMSSLGKHMFSHTGESKHFCHLCGKKFTQNGQLRMHIRSVHEGIKPHCCEVCGKRFSNKSICMRHTETHTVKKVYACDKCGRKYSSTATLNRHKKKSCKGDD